MKIALGVVAILCALCQPLARAAQTPQIRLATTTSVENSGLLPRLLPAFESLCECEVLALVVGSGRALALAERGDVDLTITHAPTAEAAFVADGGGIDRREIMRNDFILIGPPDDPAQAGGDDIFAALRAVRDRRARFVSRGDDSGTHIKETGLWRRMGFSPSSFAPEWYVAAGVGMGQAILLADELRGYTLSDRGTYLFFRDRVDLIPLVENHPPLENPYSVMRVNPARHPRLRADLAARFIDWISSPPIQKRIGAYRIGGRVLFTPTAKPR